MTFDEIFKNYEILKEPILSAHTFKTNQSYYYNHIQPVFGTRAFTELRYLDYQKFANNLLANNLKPKTVKNIFIVLFGIQKVARMNGDYDGENWLSYVELPKFDNRRYFTISSETQKSYIRAILDFQEPIYKDIFLFLLHGRRLNEVLDLKWEFIDINQGIMYLPALRNKSRKNLSFQMTDIQIQALKKHQKLAHEAQGTSFITGHIFINPVSGLRYADVRKPWIRLLSNAGLPKIRIHDIRHLVATYLINELNLPVEIVSHLLGHSDIKITQRYINPKPANAKMAMDKLINSVDDDNPTLFTILNHDLKLTSKLVATL